MLSKLILFCPLYNHVILVGFPALADCWFCIKWSSAPFVAQVNIRCVSTLWPVKTFSVEGAHLIVSPWETDTINQQAGCSQTLNKRPQFCKDTCQLTSPLCHLLRRNSESLWETGQATAAFFRRLKIHHEIPQGQCSSTTEHSTHTLRLSYRYLVLFRPKFTTRVLDIEFEDVPLISKP